MSISPDEIRKANTEFFSKFVLTKNFVKKVLNWEFRIPSPESVTLFQSLVFRLALLELAQQARLVSIDANPSLLDRLKDIFSVWACA